jgi:hypothetical protein
MCPSALVAGRRSALDDFAALLGALLGAHVHNPLPLQEFFPAQLFPAPAQLPLPAHSFTPEHFTLASLLPASMSFMSAARDPRAPKRAAADNAINAPLVETFTFLPPFASVANRRDTP